MGASVQDTGAFDASALNHMRCPDCSGTGELRIDSENINENFEVEKQTVITRARAATGRGFSRRVKIRPDRCPAGSTDKSEKGTLVMTPRTTPETGTTH